jgi:hypothetical protein
MGLGLEFHTGSLEKKKNSKRFTRDLDKPEMKGAGISRMTEL